MESLLKNQVLTKIDGRLTRTHIPFNLPGQAREQRGDGGGTMERGPTSMIKE